VCLVASVRARLPGLPVPVAGGVVSAGWPGVALQERELLGPWVQG
jgi:hypothetical protein